MRDCSQSNISQGKAWVMEHVGAARMPSLGRALAEVARCEDGIAGTFEGKLHLVYLVNDVLYHAHRKGLRVVVDSVQPFLGSMLGAAYHAHGVDKAKRDKIAKILQIWATKELFPEPVLAGFRAAMMVPPRASDQTHATHITAAEKAAPDSASRRIPLQTELPARPPPASTSDWVPTSQPRPPTSAGPSAASIAPPGVLFKQLHPAPMASNVPAPAMNPPSMQSSFGPPSGLRPPTVKGAGVSTAMMPMGPPVVMGMDPNAAAMAAQQQAQMQFQQMQMMQQQVLMQQQAAAMQMQAAMQQRRPPERKYFDLPAALIVPLIPKASMYYAPLVTSMIKLPPSRPTPSADLLEAVGEFYKGLDLQRLSLSKQPGKNGLFAEEEEGTPPVEPGDNGDDEDDDEDGMPMDGNEDGAGPRSEAKRRKVTKDAERDEAARKFDRDGWERGFLDDFLEERRRRRVGRAEAAAAGAGGMTSATVPGALTGMMRSDVMARGASAVVRFSCFHVKDGVGLVVEEAAA
ncbi:hypothetical protein HK101_006713 [Irineochytrium annulatum]|nr:hypothetical protein HK101_006713 [Irineochytrium annulatum]